ncbi:MAG TPA: cytochrome c3 family protein, partial [Labilithrix sp.]|nr:cytochrome c3 family protein [Labilithrix sp.]
ARAHSTCRQATLPSGPNGPWATRHSVLATFAPPGLTDARAPRPRVNLFPAYANQVLWLALGALGAAIVGTPAVLIAWARTGYATDEEQPPEQPVKFDHRHHARDDGIRCEYCHEGALTGAFAGVPPTARCMNCHSQIWTSSPELSLVRNSYFTNAPIRWVRVHRLPDFVFFNHAAHTKHGVGCVTCHGRVDLMAQVSAVAPLTMRWCLDCHREPEKHLRPLDKITDMSWKPEGSPEAVGREVREQLGVRSLVHCSACHR